MAVARDNPYGAFNFVISADGLGDNGSLKGGFQECSGLNMEVTVAEYRNGNEPENHTRKMNGLAKTGDVTLKRGVVGLTEFFDWIDLVRTGDQSAPRTVTIQLMDESHAGPVVTWKLTNARPTKYTGPTLNAKGGTDVAMEELVIASEKIDIE